MPLNTFLLLLTIRKTRFEHSRVKDNLHSRHAHRHTRMARKLCRYEKKSRRDQIELTFEQGVP